MSRAPRPENEPEPHKTVLDSVADLTGEAPKVFLPDDGSEHGASPVVTPGSGDAPLKPRGHGNYQIMGEIARGGMGLILKGHDTDLGRDVAFKVLDPDLAKNPAVVQRFVEEAQIGGQLQHPGIVPVYELGLMADERPYFTMKLIKGRTLSALLQQRKDPSESRGRMLSIFASVCQTVAYAHSKGVLHRDLKPANIMIGAFGEVMVVDWGLAKVLNRGGVADEKRARHDKSMMTVIETVRSGPGSSGSDSLVGSVMGTPAYMPPEQAQGEVEKLDERADVFALGAVLCEILTGAPPYEDIEGEHTVMQAARALLDPARERIEDCKADETMKRLCLDCLMPAPAARPRDADEVARAVHEFQSSIEERAHHAELEAATARIKAKEERRARKLTLALAGAVLAAVTLGGGGYYLVEKQREEHQAQARAAVENAHGEGVELTRAGKPAEAVEAARRALALAEAGAVDEALLERARRFLRDAEEDLDAVERERKLLEQDEAFRSKLEELRLDQVATIGNPSREVEYEAAFAQAFRDYGADLEAADITPALERFRDRDIAEEVALALDDWGRLSRRVHGARAEKTRNLAFLAMDLDFDPERRRLREAILADDLNTLLELAQPEHLQQLSPGSVWVLGAILWDRFNREDVVYRIYDHALYLYPDDFILQSVGGRIYNGAGRTRASLMCRIAAMSLRPQSPQARAGLAEALFFAGQMTESEGLYRASLALGREDAETHYGLGATLLQLGDFAAAEIHIARSLELDPNIGGNADLASARFFQGKVSREDIVDALRRAGDTSAIATYAYALVAHPDPRERAPEAALQAMANPLMRADSRYWVVDTVAHVEAGDHEGALAIAGGQYSSGPFVVLTPAALDFLRAVIYVGVDRVDAAEECYARGMANWAEVTAGSAEAWERSDVMRWRRRAEAALGL